MYMIYVYVTFEPKPARAFISKNPAMATTGAAAIMTSVSFQP
jgi:hypothetical protein